MKKIAANDNIPVLVSLNAACAMTSMSRTMLNKYRAQGRFPKAVELGEKRVAFVRQEVIDWIDSRIAARETANDNKPSIYQERPYLLEI